jgi:hypothetical protein
MQQKKHGAQGILASKVVMQARCTQQGADHAPAGSTLAAAKQSCTGTALHCTALHCTE